MRRLLVLVASLLTTFGPAPSAKKHPPNLWLEPNPTAVSLGRSTEVTVSINYSKKRTLRFYVCDGQGASCVNGGGPMAGTVSVVARQRDTAVVRYRAPVSAPADSFCIPMPGGCGISLKIDLVNDNKKVVASSTAILRLLGDPPERGRARVVRTGDYPAEILVDEGRGLLFMTVTGSNAVEVLSLPDARPVRTISVPRPLGIDWLPSGLVLVGGETQFLHLIDPDLLRVVDRVALPPIESWRDPAPLTRPVDVAALADGTVLVSTGAQGIQHGRVVRWNPAMGTFSDFLPGKDALSPPALSRSADGERAVVSIGGDLYLLDVATGVVVGPSAQKAHSPIMSPDGERIVGSAYPFARVFDASLTNIETLSYYPDVISWYVYSPDGQRLYLWMEYSGEVQVLDASTFELIGKAYSVGYASTPDDTRPAAADSTGLIFGLAPHALTLTDASTPALTLPPRGGLSFVGPYPEAGAPGVATEVRVDGGGLSPGASLYFGDTPADPVTVEDSRHLRTVAPPLPQGVVDLTLVHPDGWSHTSPESYVYGPKILSVSHDAGPPGGGTRIQLAGYGLDFDPSKIEITIGGRPVSELSTAPSEKCWSCRGAYRTLRFKAPGGSPGVVDIKVKTPVGTDTRPASFEYLRKSHIEPLSGDFGQILHDPRRNVIYLTQASEDRILVYDLDSRSWRPPLETGSYPVTLALSGDGSRLLVVNSVDKTVSILDPDGLAGPVEIDVVDPADTLLNPRPWRIAAAGGRAFVTIVRDGSGCGGRVREIELATLTVRDRTDGIGTCGTNGILVAPDAAGSHILVADTGSSRGGLALYDAASDTFTAAVDFGSFFQDACLADGGTRAAVDFVVMDQGLRRSAEMIEEDTASITGPRLSGEKLHESGALLYVPYYVAIEILDAHTGARRARIAPPAPLLDSLDILAVDSSGRFIVALTVEGLWIAEMAAAPLAIGSVEPAEVPAATGGTVRIHGTGFDPGATVLVDDVAVGSAWHDSTNLEAVLPGGAERRVRISVINPGGSRYDLDTALSLVN